MRTLCISIVSNFLEAVQTVFGVRNVCIFFTSHYYQNFSISSICIIIIFISFLAVLA